MKVADLVGGDVVLVSFVAAPGDGGPGQSTGARASHGLAYDRETEAGSLA
jgi:hypothetical protein